MQKRLHPITHLNPQIAQDILENYDIGRCEALKLCDGGLVNSNYFLQAREQGFLLRIYPKNREIAEILFETSILIHLSQQGFACQKPVFRKDGTLLSKLGEHKCCILTYLPGITLSSTVITPALAMSVGRTLGAMQKALANFQPAGKKRNADFECVKFLARDSIAYIEKIDGLMSLVSKLQTEWKDVEQYFTKDTNLAVGIVHADISADNVVDFGADQLGFIDFEDAYTGWTLGDVALAMMEFSFTKTGILSANVAQSVLAGYGATCAVKQEDATVLVPLMRMLAFKFFCYTLSLAGNKKDIETNPYLARIVALSTPSVKSLLQDSIAQALRTSQK